MPLATSLTWIAVLRYPRANALVISHRPNIMLAKCGHVAPWRGAIAIAIAASPGAAAAMESCGRVATPGVIGFPGGGTEGAPGPCAIAIGAFPGTAVAIESCGGVPTPGVVWTAGCGSDGARPPCCVGSGLTRCSSPRLVDVAFPGLVGGFGGEAGAADLPAVFSSSDEGSRAFSRYQPRGSAFSAATIFGSVSRSERFGSHPSSVRARVMSSA